MTDSAHRTVFDLEFPVAKLLPGHKHPFFPANPRKGGHEVSLPELAQSIHDQGVLQPLRIFTDMHAEEGKYWVHVGERRLLAAELNIANRADARHTVPVLIIDGITPQEAFQESLTEQLNRLPLHPIDQYEAFAELERGGMDDAAIAAHYGIAKQMVRQRKALGALSPKVREAWRGGAIDEKCAQEFTRLASHKEQDKLFDRQRKSHGLNAGSIRAVLVPDQGEGARLVNFVGLDAYRERGGEIREDLFNGIHGVSDIALVSTMAKEKLEAEALRLTSMEGWSWATPASDMPAAWHSYPRSEPKAQLTPAERKRLGELADILNDEEGDFDQHQAAEAESSQIEEAARFRAFTDRQKKKSGCVLSIDQQGKLAIEAGVILPETAPEEERPAQGKTPAAARVAVQAEPEEEPTPKLSNSQASDLAVTLTESMALVVEGNFNLAMSVALAAFAINSDGLPARLYHRGMGSDALRLTNQDFEKSLAGFLKMKPQQREALFAKVIAASLKLDSHTAEFHAMKDSAVAAFVNAVDPKVAQAAILKRFDPEAYFERAPKAFALAAIKDVLGDKGQQFSETDPKGEIVAYALSNVPPAQWLPVELRPAGYTGPGAKKPATKAKAKAKKKGGR